MKLSVKVRDHLHDVIVERLNGHYIVEVDGKRHEVDSHKLEGNFYSFVTENRSYEVSVERDADTYIVRRGAAQLDVLVSDPSRQARDARPAGAGPQKIVSQMPGKVVRVLVAPGDVVGPGDGLVVVEAMKMENEIASEKGGTVTQVAVSPGDAVEGGALLLIVE
jgi:biotin carboxyl carrier protein